MNVDGRKNIDAEMTASSVRIAKEPDSNQWQQKCIAAQTKRIALETYEYGPERAGEMCAADLVQS